MFLTKLCVTDAHQVKQDSRPNPRKFLFPPEKKKKTETVGKGEEGGRRQKFEEGLKLKVT